MMSLKIPHLKLHILLLLVVVINAIAMTSCQNSSLNSYIPYEAISESEVFRIKVNGQQVFVGKEECFGDSTFHTSQFFVEGETEITIECIDPIVDFAIRPYHKKIKGEVSGKVLKFRVLKPQMLMVNINEFKPLALFQTPPETDIPDPNDPDVIYYEKGIHEVGLLSPKSGQTIYMEQGAWVKGRIYGEGVENVNIKGRGVIDARGFTDKPKKHCGLEFKNSKNILVDGIGLRTGPWWQSLYILCENVEVKNMNLMSFGVNNDGIDIDGVTNFKASNCWIGCGDDGFGWHAVDAEANGQPPTKNCVAENCVIFNSHAGNGLRVGASMETELFEDITFKDITVFAHAGAGIRSDHSDWATCRNIRFENFYIEQPGRPIEVRIEKTRYSNSTGYKDERGQMLNWEFINVQSPGGEIQLAGYDKNHAIDQVSFINCCIGGRPLKETSIDKNEFVTNVEIENFKTECVSDIHPE